MTNQRNGAVTLGIILGVLLGVVLSKAMDHFATPVRAAGEEGKRIATEQSEIFRKAARTIAPSVVAITTLQKVRMQEGGEFRIENGMPFYKPPRIKEGLYPMGAGSGFVIDAKSGYVLTNNHVVSEGMSWIVRLPDKRELEAKLVGVDPQTDIAILKIDAAGLTPAVYGDSSKVEVGDWVLAVGNPFGLLEQTVTAGIISAKGRQLGLSNYEDYLQTDAAINMGNSGGPLVDIDGAVIGINTAIMSKTGNYEGIGFAIPINQAKDVALKLIHSGKVVRGWMGVEVKDLTEGGASVEGVYLHGPAQKAGILPGDVLLNINGKAIRSARDISVMVAGLEPSTSVPVKLKRNTEVKSLHVVLGNQPADWNANKNGE